jgi:hypothetical protein
MASELIEASGLADTTTSKRSGGGGGAGGGFGVVGALISRDQGGRESHRPPLALVNTFRLQPGPAPNGSCGIDVAAVAGLPPTVLARARQVAAALEGTDAATAVAGGGGCDRGGMADDGGGGGGEEGGADRAPAAAQLLSLEEGPGGQEGGTAAAGGAGGGWGAERGRGGGAAACAVGHQRQQGSGEYWEQDELEIDDDDW